jgi:DNA-binding Lrp family transcriptional regulator
MTKSIDNEVQRIRDALADDTFKSHVQIRKSLGISPSTYSRRLKQIEKEDIELLDSNSNRAKLQGVERVKEAFELTSKINREIALDKKQQSRNRIQSSIIFLQTEIHIFNNGKTNALVNSLPSVEKFFEIKPSGLEDIKPFNCNVENTFEIGDAYDK